VLEELRNPPQLVTIANTKKSAESRQRYAAPTRDSRQLVYSPASRKSLKKIPSSSFNIYDDKGGNTVVMNKTTDLN
jgi:hypothetical protein